MSIPSSPSTALYTLGRGLVEIGEWDGTTPPAYPAEFTDVGNVTDFTVTVTEETKEHFTTRSGTRLLDKTVIIESGFDLSITLDEKSLFNLAMFLKGTVVGNVISANTNLSKEYAIRFTSDNAEGLNEVWALWRVTLAPDGSISLISDEWAEMGFSGSGLADLTNHPTSPYFDVTVVDPDATTTTTATPTTTTTA